MKNPQQRQLSDEEKKEAQVKEKHKYAQLMADVYSFADTPSGRRVFFHLLAMCRMNQSSFTGTSQTFFNEGERNIGIKISALLEQAHPEAHILMLQESFERKKLEK